MSPYTLHPYRRRLLIVLLALGTVGGYASGFASLARHRHCPAGGWREHWGARGPQGPGGLPTSSTPPASVTAEAPLSTWTPASPVVAR
ncbi:hypothetical protein LY474_08530 [Myxococcus stipitatus]|uniref:hypothetical protein n=1 Tax=Myxococcus stipitatus TaxID=83455 RepID=UPI001F18A90A|nr:hypothetical protein [Myxococcus stipitatus]MCE9667853.1 hypothetical protein [Myxococcus stipitatus]